MSDCGMANAEFSSSRKDESDPSGIDPAVRPILSAIKAALADLSPLQRAQLLAELAVLQPALSAPRAGEILGKIIRLLPRQRTWTVEQVKQCVADEGISAEPKDVYNAMTYLARKGRITRLGYGRYSIDGAVIETCDDLGLEKSKNEDEPDQ